MTAFDATNPSGGSALNPLELRRRWLAMDGNKAVLAWARTRLGQAVIYGAFAALILAVPLLRFKHSLIIAIGLGLTFAFPRQRFAMITGMGFLYFLVRPFRFEGHYAHFAGLWSDWAMPLPVQAGLSGFGVFFVLAVMAYLANQRSGTIGFASRRPILTLFFLCAALTATVALVPANGLFGQGLWLFLTFLSGAFFFIGYLLIDNRGKQGLSAGTEAGFLRPIWADGTVPIKGPNYLRKFEAKNDEQLAQTRLKALKLIVWASILYVIWNFGFERGVYGSLGFLRLEAAIAAGGQAHPLLMRWLIVGVDFFSLVLWLGAVVHTLIAVIRLAGFGVPRGMAKPLASRTIAEFWGRYLFYFKELLADFFFYPTFQRFFKKNPKLRIAFATFMAAFVGNVLFDLTTQTPFVAINGFWATIDNFYSYTIYAAILTAGIIASQLHTNKARPEDGMLRYDILPRIQVIGFFAALRVFDDSSGSLPVGERIHFFLSMFGVTP